MAQKVEDTDNSLFFVTKKRDVVDLHQYFY